MSGECDNCKERALYGKLDLPKENHYGEIVVIDGPVICNDGTKFEDYSWEQHLKYLGFGVPKDE